MRITDGEIAAKLRYYRAMSKKSYTNIFRELVGRENINREMDRKHIFQNQINRSSEDMKHVASFISSNAENIIELARIILLKLGRIKKGEQREKVTNLVLDDLEKILRSIGKYSSPLLRCNVTPV